MKRILVTVSTSLVLISGCGSEPGPVETGIETRTLHVTDSIGVEMGDSA